ncbi:MAG: ABC transporter substrate-binding protein [Anaerolineales bacterium]|nr:MAG: ABC transporter substrate-binding protein [Anaerolineales bacterium]
MGSVLGAGLASACQTAATPAATEAPAVTEAPGAATEAPGEAPTQAPAVVQEMRDINVVGIFPVSGFIAADGIEMRNGTVMAIDEINELGGLVGHRLNYIEVDDVDSVGDQVTTAFERAIDVEKADVIFSGYHLTSGPEFDICANAGVLYYNVNTQKAWTDRYAGDPEKYWSIFQNDPNDEWYGQGFARYLNDLVEAGQYTPTSKTAAIIHGDEAYGTSIGKTFEDQIQEFGWEITMNEAITVGNVSDWGPLLSKVRDNPPGILFTADYNPADNAAMIKQWVADPLPCLLYQQYGPSVPEYLELAGDAANGVIWATVLGFLPDEIGMDFVSRYEARFDQTPGFANAPGCYDEVWVWAKAVALAGDPFDYKKVARLTETGIHRGVTGSISFENHGGRCYPWQTKDSSLGQAHTIFQIQNKQQVLVFPDPYTTGAYQAPPWF